MSGEMPVDSGSGDDDHESLTDTWRRRVQVFWIPLTRNTRPIKILRKMRLFHVEDDVLEKIIDLDTENQSILASEKLLEYLIDDNGLTADDVRARWSSFGQALTKVHPFLDDIVNGKCDAETHELQKKLVQFFMDEICEDVDPAHLIRDLISKELIGAMEGETMMRITEQKGPTLGTIYMVGQLPRSTNRDWYNAFLKVLKKNGYEELAKKLDDSDNEKPCHKYTKNRPSAADELPMLKVSGDADDPGPMDYAGAPSQSKEDEAEKNLNYLTDDEKLCSRGQSMDDSEVFHDCVSSTTFLRLDDKAHDLDHTDPKLLMVSSSDTDTAQTKTKRLRVGDGESSGNREMPHQKKESGSKNIDTPNGDGPSPPDNSKEEFNSPKKGGGEEDEEDEEEADIDLRDYQRELADWALSGKNAIICAPTGSGKTHVAMKIIYNHLQQQGRGVRKVVFLVNQVALAEQQFNQCAKYLKGFRCKRVTGNSGDAEKVPLKHLLQGADVMVMTAQILLDTLDQKEIDGICQFSLIVFDECHHTNHKHPFNSIMHHYMAVKYRDDDQEFELPQVVGLTASVGVGKANRQEQARNHIQKLCAHLDASFICTVNRNVEQLAQFSNDPTYSQFICRREKDDDAFQQKIEDIMRQIEVKMDRSEYKIRACADSGDLESKLNPPRTRGTIQYGGWVSQLRKEVAKVRDPDARRFLESCRRMFEFYNTALTINDACDTEDALKYLVKQIDITYDSIGNRQVEVDIFLKELFEKNQPYLEEVSIKQANTNPKLVKLEELLVKAFRDEPESRAIIFVKTRDLAAALQQWMLRRPQLKTLKPGKMVGAGPSVESGGMTKNQQVDVMKYFREGDRKVMVATSVAEEGLDIRKCNLVIRYEHVSNEIAMVQARGRARADNSKFVTLASDDKGVQAKEEVNFIREMMMRDAITELQAEMRTNFREFQRKLTQIQKEEKSMRDLELAQRKGRQKRQGEVEFRCRKCDEYAFMSSDIRKIENMHHVVTDLEFRERHNERPNPRPETFGNIQVRGKLLCKNCGQEWGRSILHKDTKFPVVKLEGFVLTDEFDRKDAPKKWKQTNFLVNALEPEELEEYRKKASDVGYTEDE